MPRIPPELCARCKGYKRLCGLPTCPILESFRAQARAALSLKGKSLEGATPPGVLVGEHGYPYLNLYLLIPPGIHGSAAREYEDPEGWARRKVGLPSIIRLRAGTVGAKLRVNATDPFELYSKEIGLAALSREPVDTEAELQKPPLPRLRFHGITKPLGPSAPAERVKVSSSPKVVASLEKQIWDDAPAVDAVWELYRSGVGIYEIQRAFSLGFLGSLRRRRLVPTRWSITAVDEILSRRLRSEIRVVEEISAIEVYQASYLGNRFFIILLLGEGTFEWIEVWHPNTVWTRRSLKPVVYYLREDPLGRKTMEDGGYSAARISVLEHLARRKRRADAVIVREVLPSYYAPVGNWHIRETVKRALLGPPAARPSTREEASRLLAAWMRTEPATVLARSLLLGTYRRQSKLSNFFNI